MRAKVKPFGVLEPSSIAATSATAAWVGFRDGSIARTSDGGATWPVVRDLSAGLTYTGDLTYRSRAPTGRCW